MKKEKCPHPPGQEEAATTNFNSSFPFSHFSKRKGYQRHTVSLLTQMFATGCSLHPQMKATIYKHVIVYKQEHCRKRECYY